MCASPACSLARQGARVVHVSVATFVKALRALGPASPVRTAAVRNLLTRPNVRRRRLQLYFRQPFLRSFPTFSRNRASENPAARSFIDESRPACGGG